MTDHEAMQADLAGYVLGGLTVAEQRAVEDHLAGCAACRAELADLEPLPVLLELARPDPTEPPTAPPSGPAAEPVLEPPTETPIEPGIESGAAGSHRGRVLVGALAAVAVLVALLVGVALGRPDSPTFSAPIALQAADTSGVASGGPTAAGTAALRPTDTGTLVRLDLTGLPTADGTWFECLWSSNQGDQSAGTFRAAADGSVHVDLMTAARRYPGWTLVIVEHAGGAADGRPVLRATA
jgi:hypothetical protein